MPAYKPIDPTALMTRADFVIELLTMWHEALQIIERNPSGSVPELGAKAELEAAVYVLKRSYPVSELMHVEAYDHLKTTIDKMELIWTRYEHDLKLINDMDITGIDKERLLSAREKARDEELHCLDRRPDASI